MQDWRFLAADAGRVVAPDRVDQLVGAHRLPQPRGQGLQYDSVVGAETARVRRRSADQGR